MSSPVSASDDLTLSHSLSLIPGVVVVDRRPVGSLVRSHAAVQSQDEIKMMSPHQWRRRRRGMGCVGGREGALGLWLWEGGCDIWWWGDFLSWMDLTTGSPTERKPCVYVCSCSVISPHLQCTLLWSGQIKVTLGPLPASLLCPHLTGAGSFAHHLALWDLLKRAWTPNADVYFLGFFSTVERERPMGWKGGGGSAERLFLLSGWTKATESTRTREMLEQATKALSACREGDALLSISLSLPFVLPVRASARPSCDCDDTRQSALQMDTLPHVCRHTRGPTSALRAHARADDPYVIGSDLIKQMLVFLVACIVLL